MTPATEHSKGHKILTSLAVHDGDTSVRMFCSTRMSPEQFLWKPQFCKRFSGVSLAPFARKRPAW